MSARIRKAKLSPRVLKLIKTYREKRLRELKRIPVRWAHGINRKHVRYPTHGCRTFIVNINDLVSSADFGEMCFVALDPQKLFAGVDERDFRVAQILDHWNAGGYIDPPEICLNHLGRVTFGDGRHRTIAAFHLGEKRIPVRVHVSLIKDVSRAIKLMRQ